jgi:L-amino acid N-acyltransferase YncA
MIMVATIRLASLNDAAQVRDIYAPFCEHTPVSFETHAPTAQEMSDRIAKILRTHPWLVYENEGKVLGYAYASPHRERAAYRWAVDVSAYVREGHRRLGVGRSLYRSLLALLQLQGFYRALAGITLPNPGSIGLHQAMGFQPLGTYQNIGYKCGRWHDVMWFQLALRDCNGVPEDPLNFEVVRQLPQWKERLVPGLALAHVSQGPHQDRGVRNAGHRA